MCGRSPGPSSGPSCANYDYAVVFVMPGFVAMVLVECGLVDDSSA